MNASILGWVFVGVIIVVIIGYVVYTIYSAFKTEEEVYVPFRSEMKPNDPIIFHKGGPSHYDGVLVEMISNGKARIIIEVENDYIFPPDDMY